jgi:hypothetical protein
MINALKWIGLLAVCFCIGALPGLIGEIPRWLSFRKLHRSLARELDEAP